jgi:hypothetical protein
MKGTSHTLLPPPPPRLIITGCPVCLDSSLEVAVSPCGHGLCLECAAQLSRAEEGGRGLAGAAVVPPLCPLCRGLMGSFALI